MSDENVGGLVIQWRHNAQGCGRGDAQAAATWRSCARQLEAALSAHGQPVVDAELIERLRALQSVFITQDAGWPGSAPHRNVYSARAELIGQAISALGATP